MKLNNDMDFKKLSQTTLSELNNIFSNCEIEDIADYIFQVINDAYKREELKEGDDMWRLCFKALNQYNYYENNKIKSEV